MILYIIIFMFLATAMKGLFLIYNITDEKYVLKKWQAIDILALVIGFVYYQITKESGFDFEVIKDVALGFLIATKTYDWIYRHIEKYIFKLFNLV